MNEKIYCKDCRFCQSGYCHRMPPTLVSWHKDALFPKVDDYDWCGMAERREGADPKFVAVGKVEAGDAVCFASYGETAKMEAENNRLRKLMCEIRDLFDWRGQYRGTSPLKSECLMEIYAIASEEDEKRRNEK